MLNHSTLLLLPNPREITLSQDSYRFPISGSIVLPSTERKVQCLLHKSCKL